MGNNDEKKEEIISWLNKLGRLPSSRFVGLMGIDYDTIKKLLDELELEGKIKREEETKATYWIPNGKEI